MFDKLKGTIKQDHTENKSFHFEKDGIRLDFTLRIDVKKELLSFDEILKEAQKIVEEELKIRFK